MHHVAASLSEPAAMSALQHILDAVHVCSIFTSPLSHIILDLAVLNLQECCASSDPYASAAEAPYPSC